MPLELKADRGAAEDGGKCHGKQAVRHHQCDVGLDMGHAGSGELCLAKTDSYPS